MVIDEVLVVVVYAVEVVMDEVLVAVYIVVVEVINVLSAEVKVEVSTLT